MSGLDDRFFAGKRHWSRIKDQVLGSYMAAYLAKVRRLGEPIVLIDGYAGPGVFGDGTAGSPMIMCQAAEKFVKGRYEAIFINKHKEHHKKLEAVLGRATWLGSAQPILGDSTQLLQHLAKQLGSRTVFLYLDPFGLIGCKFALLEPFLHRNASFSTEIVLTMCMPIVHRLAARHAQNGVATDQQDPYEQALLFDPISYNSRRRKRTTSNDHDTLTTYHQVLTDVFGGEYWKEIMWQPNADPKEREIQLMTAYRAKLAQYLPYTGVCPVRERENSRTKYLAQGG